MIRLDDLEAIALELDQQALSAISKRLRGWVANYRAKAEPPASEAAWVRVVYSSGPRGETRNIYIDDKSPIILSQREWQGLANCVRHTFGYAIKDSNAPLIDLGVSLEDNPE